MKALKALGYWCVWFLPAWLLAVIVTTLAGVFFQSQNVMARLSGVGADIDLAERLSMTGYDLAHLSGLYGAFIAIGLLIAFLFGLIVFRLAKFGRPIVFAVAGGVAMGVMLTLMKEAFFGVQLIAGARDMTGFTFQILAGVMGGLVFADVSQRLRNWLKLPIHSRRAPHEPLALPG